MHLAAFVQAGPVSGHHGGWRHPDADTEVLSADYYARLGKLLEDGRFDLLFLADILAVPQRFEGSLDSQLRYGALGALRLEPLITLATVAAHTRHLGLASTISTSYFEPFAVARSLATLDHLSGGRAAWNIVTSFQQAEAANFGLSEQLSREARYDRADEFVEIACKLWNSWGDGAVVRDKEAPLFADPSQVAAINHAGKYFRVQGPLNVSRPPQGRPVFIQAGASGRGRDFAAKWADVIFVNHSSLESAQAFYEEMKGRAASHGRDPASLKILPGIVPIVGQTDAEAQEADRQLQALALPQAGLSTLSYHLDIDLAQFPQDEILPDMDVPGVQGHYKEVAELTRKQGLTLSQLGHRYGVGTLRDFVGSGKAVADTMEAWFRGKACDGFMIQASYLPGGMEQFVRLAVPQLQARGLFRREYGGTTLRDHLGLARP
ncbi:LLM class flavin-dependent oxidoreductase [Bordetella hinzii]|uniref:FMN-dependent monooxygenase n=4 Tax=Bordetella hinzii TaxID=103855 RepID=A0AAN1S0D4_9BORD|nr:FMN-dependent monooxygenase [Bordetella hinzii]KCB33896.1 FMN-dependent oxidoreductase, nitrilotriacetate monooxygenase family [Bordetella hinzii L60]KXA70597.1 nitrilotriacetate monooxygenase [Bordetella hinzii LMG 13501]QDJ34287.1 nitrilotriacetate monooxygenase [Bordetella hinzii]QDJ38875.1 nitrilotriacetate monooxygenase [Bordetella hinzii]